MRIILSSSGFVRAAKSGSLQVGGAENSESDLVLPRQKMDHGGQARHKIDQGGRAFRVQIPICVYVVALPRPEICDAFSVSPPACPAIARGALVATIVSVFQHPPGHCPRCCGL